MGEQARARCTLKSVAQSDDPEQKARRHVRNAKLEMWGWAAFAVPYLLFWRDSIVVVGILSIYALIISARGVVRAGEAEVAGYVNPDMGDEDA